MLNSIGGYANMFQIASDSAGGNQGAGVFSSSPA
jgi:hypothetical protein